MNFKKISLLIVLLLIADQALKIWIKTHMHLDESIVVFPDWFQLRFIENNGAAFGMHIASRGGFDRKLSHYFLGNFLKWCTTSAPNAKTRPRE